MALDIRPVTGEEMEEFLRVAGDTLLMRPGESTGMRPEYTLCSFDDGVLTTTYAAWPLTMRLNGKDAPVSGVTHVGTLPVFRRRGYLKKITIAHFERLHEEGERPIAVLWAANAAIYQRYGYGIVSTSGTYRIEPEQVKFACSADIPGTLSEHRDDGSSLLEDMYREFLDPRTGYLQRSKEMWGQDFGPLAVPREGARLNKVVYREAGKPRGYVIYMMNSGRAPDWSNTIYIRELVWNSVSAYRAIWEHFSPMDIIKTVIWSRVPPDDPLPHLLLEPKKLNETRKDGLMGRIIDVARAMPLRDYGGRGSLTFGVIDTFCPWNDGTWKLEYDGAESRASRTDGSPQVVMPASTLAMLLFGQVSATEAARMGRLEASDPSILSFWDSAIKTDYKPACADSF